MDPKNMNGPYLHISSVALLVIVTGLVSGVGWAYLADHPSVRLEPVTDRQWNRLLDRASDCVRVCESCTWRAAESDTAVAIVQLPCERVVTR